MYLMQKRYFVWDTSADQRTDVISSDNKWQYIGEVPWVVLGTSVGVADHRQSEERSWWRK